MTSFVWALLAALCWGIAPLCEKTGLKGTIDPSVGVFVRSVGVFAGLLGFIFFVPRLGAQVQAIPLRTWLWLAAGGIMASIVGQLCFYHALKFGEVSRVVPIGASYPVMTCLLGLVLLKEPFTLSKLLGVGLVMAGTYLLR